MGCKRTVLGPDTVMWECTINEMAFYQWQYEQEQREYEQEENEADARELPTREAAMYYARADVDPYWPTEDVEGTEEIDVECVPVEAL